MSYLDSQQQAATKVQLDYIATTDIAAGLSLPATTWTDLVGNLSFTVDDPNSIVEIAVSGLYLVGTTANTDFGIRLVMDSAGTPINKMCGGNRIPAAVYTNCLTGVDSVVVTGLSAGTHTVKIQINPSVSSLGYCQPASAPTTYNFQLRVLERKVMPSIFSGPQPTTKVQLDWLASTDIASGTAVTALTWTDLGVNQTFTVDDPNSVIEISVLGSPNIVAAGGGNNLASRVVIDSGGTPINKMIGGCANNTAGSGSNPLSGGGVIDITGLSAGNHTVKVQVYSQGSGTLYCRSATYPNIEFLNIRVLERKQTAALVSNCMVKLAEVIVGAGGQASIAFSNIPQGYRSLLVTLQARGDASATNVKLRMQINGDTGANYDSEVAETYSTTTGNEQYIAQVQAELGYLAGGTAPSGASGTLQLTIPNYAGTTFRKSWMALNFFKQGDSSTNFQSDVPQGEWRSTAAITSILLFPASGNFVQNTVCSLYGVS